MKNNYHPLFARIAMLVACSILLGIVLSKGLFWVALIFIPLLGILIYSLFRFSVRAHTDAYRLLEAIQYGELGLSFDQSQNKGLQPFIAEKMELATKSLSMKMENLKTEQSFYDILLSRVDTPIILADENDDIEWINQVAINIFGKSNIKNISELDSKATHIASELKEIKAGEIKTVKIEQNNIKTTYAVTVVYLTIHKKRLKLISMKDIQAPLNENQKEAWDKLIRVLTHEIMNSITPIISLAETFSDTNIEHDKTTMEKAMQVIHKRSKGLVSFVHSYQQLARVPSPNKRVFKIRQMFDNIQNLMKADKIYFAIENIPESLQILADQHLLEQVFINLIKNAWEATKKDSTSKIIVSSNQNSDQLEIQVSDNGTGMSEEIYENIFLPFYTTKQDGSGIGLSICQQIIKDHGGSISVLSELGVGSEVVVRL